MKELNWCDLQHTEWGPLWSGCWSQELESLVTVFKLGLLCTIASEPGLYLLKTLKREVSPALFLCQGTDRCHVGKCVGSLGLTKLFISVCKTHRISPVLWYVLGVNKLFITLYLFSVSDLRTADQFWMYRFFLIVHEPEKIWFSDYKGLIATMIFQLR